MGFKDVLLENNLKDIIAKNDKLADTYDSIKYVDKRNLRVADQCASIERNISAVRNVLSDIEALTSERKKIESLSEQQIKNTLFGGN